MYRQGRWGLPGEIEFLFSSVYRRLGPSLAACQKQAQERLTIGFVRARRLAARAPQRALRLAPAAAARLRLGGGAGGSGGGRHTPGGD